MLGSLIFFAINTMATAHTAKTLAIADGEIVIGMEPVGFIAFSSKINPFSANSNLRPVFKEAEAEECVTCDTCDFGQFECFLTCKRSCPKEYTDKECWDIGKGVHKGWCATQCPIFGCTISGCPPPPPTVVSPEVCSGICIKSVMDSCGTGCDDLDGCAGVVDEATCKKFAVAKCCPDPTDPRCN